VARGSCPMPRSICAPWASSWRQATAIRSAASATSTAPSWPKGSSRGQPAWAFAAWRSTRRSSAARKMSACGSPGVPKSRDCRRGRRMQASKRPAASSAPAGSPPPTACCRAFANRRALPDPRRRSAASVCAAISPWRRGAISWRCSGGLAAKPTSPP